MIGKLFQDNPLGVLLLCASVVGTGYVMNYRLEIIDKNQHDIAISVDKIKQAVSNVKSDVAGLKAVNDYRERMGNTYAKN